MTSKIILSVDVGYGNTKAVWGDESNLEICFKSLTPSTSIDQKSMEGSSANQLNRVQIDVGGNAYLVGPDAYMSGGTFHLDPDFVQRNEYLALLRGSIHYMFKQTGVVTRELDGMVLGLPVSSFARMKPLLMKVARFEHPVPVPDQFKTDCGHTVMVTVKNVIILPQPIGALRFNAESRQTGAIGVSNSDAVSLVINPGYDTFDWLVSKGFQTDLARSGSFQGGVSQLLREVSSVAGMKLGVGHIDAFECETALETGVLHINGRKIPFTEFVEVAEKAAAEVVDRFISALDKRRRFDHIIMTGGGAKFYERALRKRLPDYNITVAKDSVMHNARGFRMIACDMMT